MNKIKARNRLILGSIAIIGFILLTAGFFGIMFFGKQINIPNSQLGLQIVGMLGMLVGTWISITTMVYTFSFGSSQGSQDKGDAQNKLLEKMSPAAGQEIVYTNIEE